MGVRTWVGSVGASVLLLGCYSAPPMQVDGTLQARGGDLGDWDLAPDVCLTGEPIGFEGIDLSSADGQHCVRFENSPFKGPLVIGYLPGTDQGREFTPEQCNEFYVKLDRTTDQAGALYNVAGVMSVDCASEAGSLVGDVQFDGCW